MAIKKAATKKVATKQATTAAEEIAPSQGITPPTQEVAPSVPGPAQEVAPEAPVPSNAEVPATVGPILADTQVAEKEVPTTPEVVEPEAEGSKGPAIGMQQVPPFTPPTNQKAQEEVATASTVKPAPDATDLEREKETLTEDDGKRIQAEEAKAKIGMMDTAEASKTFSREALDDVADTMNLSKDGSDLEVTERIKKMTGTSSYASDYKAQTKAALAEDIVDVTLAPRADGRPHYRVSINLVTYYIKTGVQVQIPRAAYDLVWKLINHESTVKDLTVEQHNAQGNAELRQPQKMPGNEGVAVK